MKFEITKMGERGQIVIPQSLREHLKLETGEKFMVIEQDNSILLKKIEPPKNTWEELTRPFREAMKNSNIKESDVVDIIHEMRKEERERKNEGSN